MSQGARRGSGGPCQSPPTARGDPAVSPLQKPGPAPGCGHLRGTHTPSGSLQTLQAGGPLATQSTHLRKGCVWGLRVSDRLHRGARPCAQCQEAGDVGVRSPGSPALQALAGSSDVSWGCPTVCGLLGVGSCPPCALVPSQDKWRWPSHLLRGPGRRARSICQRFWVLPVGRALCREGGGEAVACM